MSSFRSRSFSVFNFFGKLFPPVYYLVILTNAYVWEGEENSLLSIAPLEKWWKRLLLPLIISFVLSYTLLLFFPFGLYSGAVEYVQASYPSILGFVIGLFALAVTSHAYEEVMSKSRRRAKLISIDLAYPLFVIFLVLVLTFLVNPGKWFGQGFHMSFIFYSVFLNFDVIAAVYMLSRVNLNNS